MKAYREDVPAGPALYHRQLQNTNLIDEFLRIFRGP